MEKTKSESKLSVLSLEDSLPDFEIIKEQLLNAGYKMNITHVDNERDFVSALQKNEFDIILADFRLPSFDAFKALKLCKEICPKTPFICISGSIGEETAIELIKEGAVDYILKDRLTRLPSAIKRALDEAKEKELRSLIEQELQFSENIFNCFLEHSPIFVYFKDENIRTIRLSKNFESMLGKPIAELLGKNMDDLFPSELAKKMVKDDMRIIKEGKEVIAEEELNDRFYTSIKFPIQIENKPTYLAGFTIDITDRKRMEDALKSKMHELQRFQDLTVGRELRMIELKKEINELLKQMGKEEKYKIVG
jgi:PAS domain S-box-containing protein